MVEVDAVHINPLDTDTILIIPGQTINVLLKTKSKFPKATFFKISRPYVTGLGTFDNSTVADILEYEPPSNATHLTFSMKKIPLFKPFCLL